MNLEYLRYRLMIENTNRQLTGDEWLYALNQVIDVQRKLDFTEEIEREKASEKTLR